MDQSLDMQVAALIFLAGTKGLVTSTDTGDVEMMSDNEELDEPVPISPLRNQTPPSPSKPVCVGVVAHWDRQTF